MRIEDLRLLRSRSQASQLLQKPWRVERATTLALDPGIEAGRQPLFTQSPGMDRGPCRSWLAGDRLRSSRKIGTSAVPDRIRMQDLRLLRSRSPASQLLHEPCSVERDTTLALDPGIEAPATAVHPGPGMDRGPCRSWLAGDRLRSSRKIGTCAVPDRMRIQDLRLLRSRSPASKHHKSTVLEVHLAPPRLDSAAPGFTFEAPSLRAESRLGGAAFFSRSCQQR